jgi:hypothetical protein
MPGSATPVPRLVCPVMRAVGCGHRRAEGGARGGLSAAWRDLDVCPPGRLAGRCFFQVGGDAVLPGGDVVQGASCGKDGLGVGLDEAAGGGVVLGGQVADR